MSPRGDITQQSSPDSHSGSTPPAANARTSCDLCKRMKIRCDRQDESCVHCLARGVPCELTLLPRKKQAKRGTAIHDVENRIKRLESLLAASGIDPAQLAAEDSASDQAKEPAELPDRLSTLVISNKEEGSSRFIGPSSGFSIFSPQGLQWISEITGNNDLSQLIDAESKTRQAWRLGRAEMFQSMPRHQHEPIPPKNVACHYVQIYFATFNSTFPIYDQDSFNEFLERQYSSKPPEGSAWYASLNIVMGIGSVIWEVASRNEAGAAYQPSQHPPGNKQGWKYFRNACSCFVDLMFEDCSLMAVQAICGMSFIQQITLNPQPLGVLSAAAVRLAYSIGLHRKLDGFGLSQSEIDQRRNVFWSIYTMDKGLALRSGQPSSIADADIGIDLPKLKNMMATYPDGTRKFDIFRCQVELAQLESRIYAELYSIESRKRSDLDRLKSVSQLDSDLQKWRDELPVEIRPEMPINCSKDQLVPVTMMHFSYFNCMTTVHRVSPHHGSWESGLAKQDDSTLRNQQLNPRVYSSSSICLTMARKSIQLLQTIGKQVDQLHEDFTWTVIYYPLSCFLTLFANTLKNPRDSYVASDLKLMSFVVSLINPAVTVSLFGATSSMKMFTELTNVALKYVERMNSGSTKNLKRGHNGGGPGSIDDTQIPLNNPTSSQAPLYPSNNGIGSDSMQGFYSNPTYANLMPFTNPSILPNMSTRPSVSSEALQYMEQYPNSYDFGSAQVSSAPAPSYQAPVMNDMTYNTMLSEAPMFSDVFEWDLAALWNQDYPNNPFIDQPPLPYGQ